MSRNVSIVIIFAMMIALSYGAYHLGVKRSSGTAKTFSATSTMYTSTPTVKESSSDYVTDAMKALYLGIDDDKFVNFATSVIDKKCPFYVPDGATYHECLSSWVMSLEGKELVEALVETRGYCEMFSKKYSEQISFQESELFSKCIIYTLSK